jgi:hypothetical protein
MNRNVERLFLILFIIIGFGIVNAQSRPARSRVWIFFSDKGSQPVLRQFQTGRLKELGIASRALERRRKVLPAEKVLDRRDLPVAKRYIERLQAMGIQIGVRSRWLNAVSAWLPENVSERTVTELPFVKKIRSVAGMSVVPPEETEGPFAWKIVSPGSFNYGFSEKQNSTINVPRVHDLGLDGSGVLIGMIDTGFDYANRTAFRHIRIRDEYDFHWGDDVTANEANDRSDQHKHGTMTLGVIGGYHEGELIGPAFGAEFALAKTEWVPSETRIEEDHWVAGIEWLEGLGVDIVSSSLGYVAFDGGFTYTYEDLDGNTCVTTIAADIAASKGVVVVNSAGNRDFWAWVNSPADGDSVIATGGVYADSGRVKFSEGPTYDGRIKPDVTAMGSGVYTIRPDVPDLAYIYSSGTSFSCPLVAGVCALILQAHPELGPMEVRRALRRTADRADEPDNIYGWGIVNAWDAVFYHGMIFTGTTLTPSGTDQYMLDAFVISRTGLNTESTEVYLRQGSEGAFQAVALEVTSQQGIKSTVQGTLPAFSDIKDVQYYFQASDTTGAIHTAPYDAPQRVYSFSDTTVTKIVTPSSVPAAFTLYPNFPNPFNARTTIRFDLNRESRVKLVIYNVLGQQVRILLDCFLAPGEMQIAWDGNNDDGISVPSGIYFYEIKTLEQTAFRKMVLVR